MFVLTLRIFDLTIFDPIARHFGIDLAIFAPVVQHFCLDLVNFAAGARNFTENLKMLRQSVACFSLLDLAMFAPVARYFRKELQFLPTRSSFSLLPCHFCALFYHFLFDLAIFTFHFFNQ